MSHSTIAASGALALAAALLGYSISGHRPHAPANASAPTPGAAERARHERMERLVAETAARAAARAAKSVAQESLPPPAQMQAQN